MQNITLCCLPGYTRSQAPTPTARSRRLTNMSGSGPSGDPSERRASAPAPSRLLADPGEDGAGVGDDRSIVQLERRELRRRYRELAAELASIGLIHSGSVTRRYTRCATPGCKCHADPPQPHGPYYQWTAKTNGKTVTRRLNETEAELYQEWIANDRHLRHLIQQMRQVAAKATELKLNQAARP